MKKVLFFTLALVATNINAQLLVDSLGRVGIATDSVKSMFAVYIQNEVIVSADREYNAQNVKVGNHVTDQKPQGNVNITNSKITISAQNVLLDKGTTVNLGSTLKIKPQH